MENFAFFTMASLIFFYRAYFLRYSYLSEVKILGEKQLFLYFHELSKLPNSYKLTRYTIEKSRKFPIQ